MKSRTWVLLSIALLGGVAVHLACSPSPVGVTPTDITTVPTNIGTIPTTGTGIGTTPGSAGTTPGNIGTTPTNIGTTPTDIGGAAPTGPTPGGTPAGTTPPFGTALPTSTPTPAPRATASPTATATPTPVQTLHSFTSSDVPKTATAGGTCGTTPCITSNVVVTGVTGTIARVRVGFQGSFATADTLNSFDLNNPTGQGSASVYFGATLTGAGFGSSCSIQPVNTYTSSGLTTWDTTGAPTTLEAGAPPYDRVYRSGSSPGLSRVLGATTINGTWTLSFTLQAPLTPAPTLNCWTLEIYTTP
jgi:hypothetical protein